MLKKPQKPNPKFNNQINSQGWQKERKESEGLLRELSCCQQAEGRKINTGWRESKSLVKAKEKRRTWGVVGEQDESVTVSGEMSSV